MKKNIVLKINNINLKQVESTKYLGVIIDINLNWAEHIDYIYKKIIKFTSIFYKIRENIVYYIIGCSLSLFLFAVFWVFDAWLVG